VFRRRRHRLRWRLQLELDHRDWTAAGRIDSSREWSYEAAWTIYD
jgi:hypothetical protein